MRYRYSLKGKTKDVAEWYLSHYPEDKRALEQRKTDLIPSPIAGYSLTAGVSGGTVHRSTEDVTLSIESDKYVRQITQSCEAVETVLKRCDETDMKLIDLVYWKQGYTIEGAAAKVGLSRRAAYYRINSVLCAMALEIGLVTL